MSPSKFAMKLMRQLKLLPAISPTERQALEAGDVWIDGDIFGGKLRFREVMKNPYGKLSAEEQAFIDGPCEELCAMVDPWAAYLSRRIPDDAMAFLKAKEQTLAHRVFAIDRVPTFCPGCPHNLSTHVPEGSRATAGIGCHYMAVWMDRSTSTFTQMGGEGVPWVGQAPFTKDKHVFANLGDGTYFHSGSLAIRQSIAAGVNITYKLLYNDAVAMTGGQQVGERPEGHSVMQIQKSMVAEGVKKVVIVTDQPEKYQGATLEAGITVHHRDELDRIQRELREIEGVTAIIYDQTCATEKRRRRKRGKLATPAKRVVINEAVCEGCGDCGVQSNCLSIVPVETEFGRKRQIDQSNCNKDFSCLNGFCPSFVTIHGGKLRKSAGSGGSIDPLEGVPEPGQFALGSEGWAAVVDGVGGTGVVTIGAILGMAAHLEGKGCGMIDMAAVNAVHGRMMQRLAENHQIHRARLDGRLLQLAETELQIL